MSELAMTHAGYVAAAWGATALALVGYAGFVLVRGRRLARQVRPEERRWS